MSFAVPADAYDRFMGRWSAPLAVQFVDVADVQAGQRVLDVGCGPGALTAVLVDRCGPASVTAVDPSESFVAAARVRLPDVDVRRAAADALPFADGAFDATLAQLVVHFLRDPVAGLRELARVTRPGGVVAACVWDHAEGLGPLAPFLAATADAHDESGLAGGRRGHLVELFAAAGLHDVQNVTLTVSRSFGGFDEWWELFGLGVGPAGAYVAGLSVDGRDALRERCAALLPTGAFTLDAVAWTGTGRV